MPQQEVAHTATTRHAVATIPYVARAVVRVHERGGLLALPPLALPHFPALIASHTAL